MVKEKMPITIDLPPQMAEKKSSVKNTLTVSDLPERAMLALRSRALRNHRSVNGEVLFIIDYVTSFGNDFQFPVMPPVKSEAEHQKDVIMSIAGEWKDDRSDDEIIAEIEGARTFGREVSRNRSASGGIRPAR